MINFKKLWCVMATATITFGIVYLLLNNLVWYHALLGYFSVGVILYVIVGLYEQWDKKQNPWKSYHEGTLFDWWFVLIPLVALCWPWVVYITMEHTFDKLYDVVNK